MKTARVFKNGRSQAVRLPKEFRFAADEVYVKKIGSGVLLLPKRDSWDVLVNSLGKFSTDFVAEREQPAAMVVILTLVFFGVYLWGLDQLFERSVLSLFRYLGAQ